MTGWGNCIVCLSQVNMEREQLLQLERAAVDMMVGVLIMSVAETDNNYNVHINEQHTHTHSPLLML